MKSRPPGSLLNDYHVCDTLSTVPGSQVNPQKTGAAVTVMILSYKIKMLSCPSATLFWVFLLTAQLVRQLLFPFREASLPCLGQACSFRGI